MYKTFIGTQPGLNLLFFGAIHGNEPCGTIAIQQVIKEIEAGNIQIRQGSVTFIPICNPEASKQNKRYIDINLNRVFFHHPNPMLYEETLANQIMPYIQQADILVDLHSGHTKNTYFVFQDYDDPKTAELVQATQCPLVVKGRAQLYEDSNERDTCKYAHSQGVSAITVECGQHEDPDAIEKAYFSIISVLQHYGIIHHQNHHKSEQQIVIMDSIHYYDKPGTFTQPFQHGDFITKDSIIAQYDDGDTITATQDCVIILPKHYQKNIGDEWFYLGHRA